MNKDPLIDVATADWRTLEAEGKWCSMDLGPDWVRLSYGAVLTDGTRELPIATRHYYLNEDGVAYWTAVHV